MDSITSYSSDIEVLRESIKKNNDMLNKLGDNETIQKIKNYEGINQEVSNLLSRERVFFAIYSLIAVTVSITTVKMI